MTPERHQEIADLCEAAYNQREEFLVQACADDPELRQEVEALLAYREKALLEGFLEDSLSEVTTRLLSTAQDTVMMNRTFGLYKILAVIGEGGMGKVYLAKHPSLPRKVALKLLPRQFTLDKERLERFEREAYAMAALNDNHIPTIYEVGELEGTHYIAAEYVEGETLRAYLQRRNLALDEILPIAKQIAEALKAMHNKGVIHRDIKPENIMVRPDGYIKVIDFGIARLTENWTHTLPPPGAVMTSPETVIGSVHYMSPEQIQGQTVDHRTDFFSFGVLLYEMITNRRPFTGQTFDAVKNEILKKTPERLDKYRAETPPKLQQAVTRALSKKMADRYKTAWELLADLEEIKLYGEELPEASWKLPAPVLWGGLLILGAILGGLLTSFLNNQPNPPPALANSGLVSSGPCPADSSRFGFEQSDEKWSKQLLKNSHAVTAVQQSQAKAKFGCYALELTVNLIGDDPQKNRGEAFGNLPAPSSTNPPINLEGVAITIWVFVPGKAAGDPNHPNGVQVFVEDRQQKSEYGGWLNLTDNTDKWVRVTLTPSKETPPGGHKDEGFDPTNLVAVGLKIGAGANSTATYAGPIYVDGVSW